MTEQKQFIILKSYSFNGFEYVFFQLPPTYTSYNLRSYSYDGNNYVSILELMDK